MIFRGPCLAPVPWLETIAIKPHRLQAPPRMTWGRCSRPLLIFLANLESSACGDRERLRSTERNGMLERLATRRTFRSRSASLMKPSSAAPLCCPHVPLRPVPKTPLSPARGDTRCLVPPSGSVCPQACPANRHSDSTRPVGVFVSSFLP